MGLAPRPDGLRATSGPGRPLGPVKAEPQAPQATPACNGRSQLYSRLYRTAAEIIGPSLELFLKTLEGWGLKPGDGYTPAHGWQYNNPKLPGFKARLQAFRADFESWAREHPGQQGYKGMLLDHVSGAGYPQELVKTIFVGLGADPWLATSAAKRLLAGDLFPREGVKVGLLGLPEGEKEELLRLHDAGCRLYYRLASRLNSLRRTGSKVGQSSEADWQIDEVMDLLSEFPDLAEMVYAKAGLRGVAGMPPIATGQVAFANTSDELMLIVDGGVWASHKQWLGLARLAGIIAASILVSVLSGGTAAPLIAMAMTTGIPLGAGMGYEDAKAYNLAKLASEEDAKAYHVTRLASDATVQARYDELISALGTTAVSVVMMGTPVGQTASFLRQGVRMVAVGAAGGGVSALMNPGTWRGNDGGQVFGYVLTGTILGAGGALFGWLTGTAVQVAVARIASGGVRISMVGKDGQPAPCKVVKESGNEVTLEPENGAGQVTFRIKETYQLGPGQERQQNTAARLRVQPEAATSGGGSTSTSSSTGAQTSLDLSSLDPRSLDQVGTYLQGLKAVRVFINNAPGNGHQSATVSVMKRLRQLGFRGRMEVVYDDKIKSKLQYLIPGFRPDGPEVQLLDDKIIMVSNKRFLRFREEGYSGAPFQTRLAVTGANDYYSHVDDFASARADTILTLQPMEWTSSSMMSHRGSRDLGMAGLGFVYDTPRPSDLRAFLNNSLGHDPVLQSKIEGLYQILRPDQPREILAAYGLGHYGVEKLANLIKAIQVAQTKRPEAFAGGTVVSLVSNLNETELATLGAAIAKDPSLSTVKIVDIKSPAGVSAIASLKEGEIVVASIGSVSRDVFDYLFSRSTLPPTVAGKNAMNLVKMLGKPFLNTVDDNPDIRLEGWTNKDRSLTSGNEDRLARFLLEAKDPASAVSQAYGRLSTIQDPVSNDKVLRGLVEVLNEPPPPAFAARLNQLQSQIQVLRNRPGNDYEMVDKISVSGDTYAEASLKLLEEAKALGADAVVVVSALGTSQGSSQGKITAECFRYSLPQTGTRSRALGR